MKNRVYFSMSAIALLLAVAVYFISCGKDERVNDGVHVTGVSLDKGSATLVYIDDQIELNATVTPNDADNPMLVWSSSDERVVKITSDGKKATVTALERAGTATILVKTVDNEWFAKCEIINQATPVALQALDVIDLEFAIPLGEEATFTVVKIPSNATIASITWSFKPDVQWNDPATKDRNVNQDQIFYNEFKDPETDPDLYEPSYYQYYLDGSSPEMKDQRLINFSLNEDGEKNYEDFDMKTAITLQSNVFAYYLKLGRIGILRVTAQDKSGNERVQDIPVKIILPEPAFEMVDVPTTPAGGYIWGPLWMPEHGAPSDWRGMGGITAHISKAYKIGKYTISHKEYLWAMSDQEDPKAGTEGFYWRPGTRSNQSHRTYYTLDFPVAGLSWDQCQEFITKLNAKTGRTYRMPTECEWEWAARGATEPPRSWHGGPDACKDICPAWPYDNIDCPTYSANDATAPYDDKYRKGYVACWGGGIDFYVIQDGKRQQKKLKAGKLVLRNGAPIQGDKKPESSNANLKSFEKSPNWLGAYNMIGNVQEFCSDWYADPPTTEVRNYTGPDESAATTEKVTRGGDRDNNGSSTTLFSRGHLTQTATGHTSVRLALD